MYINSRGVALLIAILVSIATITFLALLKELSTKGLIVSGFISFSTSFLLIYISIEFLVFRGVANLKLALDKIRNDETQSVPLRKNTLTLKPIRDINAKLIGYTQRKEKEILKLKELESYRKEFLADISHELKTPIFAAEGYILTLLDGAIDDPKVRKKFLKKAAKSLNGLNALVQDLLTLSQMETGAIQMNFESFNISILAKDVLDQLEDRAAKRDVQLIYEDSKEAEPDFMVFADYNKINQVLINLVTNSIKYNHENGWVKVYFVINKETITVVVEDNGLGIPPGDIDRVFDRFYRVEKSRSKKQGGSGLGLAIVKEIIENHDSKIFVESNVEKGTKFSFELKRDIATSFEKD